MPVLKIMLKSLAASQQFGRQLGRQLRGGEVLVFDSDLGGGKTTLTKAIVEGAGGNSNIVSSPSFVICNDYPLYNNQQANLTIRHYDFYRLNDQPGIIVNSLNEDLMNNQLIVIIEWPNAVKQYLPSDILFLQIEVSGQNSRNLTLNYPKDLSYLVAGVKV